MKTRKSENKYFTRKSDLLHKRQWAPSPHATLTAAGFENFWRLIKINIFFDINNFDRSTFLLFFSSSTKLCIDLGYFFILKVSGILEPCSAEAYSPCFAELLMTKKLFSLKFSKILISSGKTKFNAYMNWTFDHIFRNCRLHVVFQC